MNTFMIIFYVIPMVVCLLVTLAGSLTVQMTTLRTHLESVVFALIPVLNIYMAYLYIAGIIEVWKAGHGS